ncbi:MAG: hypothetical protein FJW86_02675 [Actinobacteria bacterium]|nr:hypothetical protein [Actinomycetota bacterium]
MTRERWIIGALIGILVAAGTVLALSGDDGGSDVAIDPANTTSTSVTTTTLATTTTVGGSPPVTVGIICTTPEEAAMTFVDAWIDGDQAAAARCATEAAVTTMFQTTGAGAQYTWQGCHGDPGMPTCSYTYEGGAVNLALGGTEAAGWKVQSVSYIAD